MKIKHYIIAALSLLLLSACSNDVDIDIFDSPAADGGAGTLRAEAATISSLQFAWDKVDGVYQYGYTLSCDGAAVRRGVTDCTSILFDNLEVATTYALRIEAFGFNGKPTTAFSTTATTRAIVQLATPDVTGMAITLDDTGRATLSWPAVENAETYDYVLSTDKGLLLFEGTVTDYSIVFNSLAVGDYILEVTADSSSEEFTRSETAVFAFHREHQSMLTFTGTYTYALGGTAECAITIFEGDVFAIRDFYGVEGFDLQFSKTSGGVITILNAVSTDADASYVATGLADNPTVGITRATFSVTPSGNRLRFYLTTGGYDQFVWKQK